MGGGDQVWAILSCFDDEPDIQAFAKDVHPWYSEAAGIDSEEQFCSVDRMTLY